MLEFLLFLAGVGHPSFIRTEFLSRVPNWVRMNAGTVVIVSGIVEILLGTSLLFLSKSRTNIGWLIAFFLIAVFRGKVL